MSIKINKSWIFPLVKGKQDNLEIVYNLLEVFKWSQVLLIEDKVKIQISKDMGLKKIYKYYKFLI